MNTPTILGPAVTPESDPANVERRFGFAEAKARREREAKKGAPSAPQPQIEPVAGQVHDHGQDHDHGGPPTSSTAPAPMCRCHAGMADKPAAPQ